MCQAAVGSQPWYLTVSDLGQVSVPLWENGSPFLVELS